MQLLYNKIENIQRVAAGVLCELAADKVCTNRICTSPPPGANQTTMGVLNSGQLNVVFFAQKKIWNM